MLEGTQYHPYGPTAHDVSSFGAYVLIVKLCSSSDVVPAHALKRANAHARRRRTRAVRRAGVARDVARASTSHDSRCTPIAGSTFDAIDRSTMDAHRRARTCSRDARARSREASACGARVRTPRARERRRRGPGTRMGTRDRARRRSGPDTDRRKARALPIAVSQPTTIRRCVRSVIGGGARCRGDG